MGFWSWLTGRNPKESDLYANYDKVAQVTDRINTIATTEVTNAQAAVYSAFNQLNSVNGLSTYVGTITVSNYDSIFQSIGETIENIGNMINDKAENIKAYEESPWYEKALSTVTMGVFKVGEGLLSVVEDLGDGVMSLVGWGAGLVGATDFQEDIANAIKKEWSHDVFNFYYESDFAKASAFTEDSALAGGLKIVGKTVGYLYAGGALAGAAGAAGIGGAAGSIAGTSLTTWGATAVGALGGLGSGTESGLNAGKTFNEAFTQGIKTGAIQGGLAFVGGKIGEKFAAKAKANEVAKAQTQVDQAANQLDDAMNAVDRAKTEAAKAADDLVNAEANLKDAAQEFAKTMQQNGLDPSQLDDVLQQAAEHGNQLMTGDMATKYQNVVDALDTYNSALDVSLNARGALTSAEIEAAAKNIAMNAAQTSLTNAEGIVIQGYSDAVTQAGQRFGASAYNTASTGLNALKTGVTSGFGSEAAQTARNAFKDSLTGEAGLLTNNPISQGANAIRSATGSTKDAVSGLVTSVKENGIVSTAVSGVKDVGSSIVSAPGAVINAAKSVAGPGVIATAAGSTLNESTSQSAISAAEKQANLNKYGLVDAVQHSDTIIEDSISAPLSPTTPTTPPTTPTTPSTSGPTSPSTSRGGGGGYTPTIDTTPVTSPSTTTPPTLAPVTTSPPTAMPTTAVPTTSMPTTAMPTTAMPTTVTPTTPKPTIPTSPKPTIPTSPKPTVPTSPTTPKPSGPTSPSTSVGWEYDGTTMEGDGKTNMAASLANLLDDSGKTIDEIIKGSATKIPTSSKPILSSKSSGSSSVIPIAAGLSVASAAGIGAKAFIDHRKSNDEEGDDEFDDEFEDDDLLVDNWSEDSDASNTIAIEEEEEETKKEFINQDKEDDDEYYRVSENPFPIMGVEELEEF